jgi:ABC-2 type transport system ATP-binding protein
VAIFSKGKLAAEGSVEALTGGRARLRLTVSPVDKALAVLGDKGESDGPQTVLADVSRAETPALIRALVEAGVEISEARWREADLESAYLGALENSDLSKNGDAADAR